MTGMYTRLVREGTSATVGGECVDTATVTVSIDDPAVSAALAPELRPGDVGTAPPPP